VQAMGLYQSFGFRVIERKENYYGDGEPRNILELKS
jgi:ribosomal protein S18 acetylase RimI-like enzyme